MRLTSNGHEYTPEIYFTFIHFDHYEPHPWMYSIQALAFMLEGSIRITHSEADSFSYNRVKDCSDCDEAVALRDQYRGLPNE